jgi:hypothetical protein
MFHASGSKKKTQKLISKIDEPKAYRLWPTVNPPAALTGGGKKRPKAPKAFFSREAFFD